jgi:ABC-type Fe3+-hydroxamate transport system substrate-binding protein
MWPALLAAVLVLAAACGSDDDNKDNGNSGTSTPSTEATFVPTPQPVTYPLTVRDMLNREVKIDAKPQRVAALSPTTVEYVYAVGGTSVTRSTSVY